MITYVYTNINNVYKQQKDVMEFKVWSAENDAVIRFRIDQHMCDNHITLNRMSKMMGITNYMTLSRFLVGGKINGLTRVKLIKFIKGLEIEKSGSGDK